MAEYIRTHYPLQQVRINYLADDTTVWDIRIPEFYLRQGIADTVINNTCVPLVESRDPVQLLVAQGAANFLPQCPELQWTEVASAQPAWKVWLMKGYDLEDAKPGWKLYESAPPAASARK